MAVPERGVRRRLGLVTGLRAVIIWSDEYWPRLTEERRDFQFHLIGDDDEILARAPFQPQGRGMSTAAVRAMDDIARRHGLRTLIAPVRPSWKERYPLVPIERYACWLVAATRRRRR